MLALWLVLSPLLAPAATPLSTRAFDWSRPAVVHLPKDLREISGIVFEPGGRGVLLGITDESADLFRIEARTGRILQRLPVEHEGQRLVGDFEDLAFIDSTLFILKSNGTLYQLAFNPGPRGGAPKATKFTTPLNEENDVEGMAYVPSARQLYLMLKESPNPGKRDPDPRGRVIFAWDPARRQLSPRPVAGIDRRAVPDKDFKPAGIAVDPLTGGFAVVSSTQAQIVFLDATGKYVDGLKFPRGTHAQPEGITFDAQGGLWISDEAGQTDRADLTYYPRRP